MRTGGTWAYLAAALIGWGAGVRADGDIVFSARYYKPGWTHSYYQLWRINPDGSGRTAVTKGDADDTAPRWMPDRRTIQFTREQGGTNFLCQVSETGGPVRVLAAAPAGHDTRVFSPDRRAMWFSSFESRRGFCFDLEKHTVEDVGPADDAAWSPDGARLLLCDSPDGRWRGRIWRRADGTETVIASNVISGCWLDNERLAVCLFGPDESSALAIVRDDGSLVRTYDNPAGWAQDDDSDFADCLYAIPGQTKAVLYGRHWGGSSQGYAQRFYRVDLETGRFAQLADGSGLMWSPDGRSFCTGTGRDLAAFNGTHQEWVSSLQIVFLDRRPVRTIVTGMVDASGGLGTSGFDWRAPP